MRITMTSVIGFGVGVILFIAASLMPRVMLEVVKPAACADGEYTEWETSVRGQNNQDRGATAVECVRAGDQRSDPSPYVMGLMCLSFLIPFGSAFVLDQVMSRIQGESPST